MTVSLSRGDRQQVRDVEARLLRIPCETIQAGPAPEWLATTLKDVFRFDLSMAYRPTRVANDSWSLGEQSTEDGAFFSRYDAALRSERQPFHYDPLRPNAADHNHAVRMRDVHHHGPETTCVVEDVWPSLGIAGHDQLRALICEGGVLLAWVGGLREEPFSKRDCAVLDALVDPLRRALSLRRILLDAGLAAAGLAGVLEAIGAPSFVMNRSGYVVHANTIGATLLARGDASTREHLRSLIKGDASEISAKSVTRLDAPGVPECYLVVLRTAPTSVVSRLAAFAAEVKATPRETAVLEGLSSGDSNKELALKLGCSEVSIERRVTSLLRKTRCDTRARLIAKFWAAASL